MCVLFGMFLLLSCKKDKVITDDDHGNLLLRFTHMVDDTPIAIDTMIYKNAAGNDYMVTEVQYFISDVYLHKSNGSKIMIDAMKDIHYVDNDIPSTQQWDVYDDIAGGDYDSITFTFGINEAKNYSLRFVDPPESFMAWPEHLGGGYHYMKLNGKWSNDTIIQDLSFMFHLGIGQIYDNDSITGFVQNFFEVALPNSAFSIVNGNTKEIEIIMNIENWFQNPYIFDFGDYPQGIMQNQEGMHKGCMNGREDVFMVGEIK